MHLECHCITFVSFPQVVLSTLTGFVEWVSINHIMAEDGRLLQILCLLLGDPIFQCAAAECLLQIVNRKGKAEDRKQLMILFSEEALKFIYTAATTSPPLTGPTDFHEKHYLFLKKLTQVISVMIVLVLIYIAVLMLKIIVKNIS